MKEVIVLFKDNSIEILNSNEFQLNMICNNYKKKVITYKYQ